MLCELAQCPRRPCAVTSVVVRPVEPVGSCVEGRRSSASRPWSQPRPRRSVSTSTMSAREAPARRGPRVRGLRVSSAADAVTPAACRSCPRWSSPPRLPAACRWTPTRRAGRCSAGRAGARTRRSCRSRTRWAGASSVGATRCGPGARPSRTSTSPPRVRRSPAGGTRRRAARTAGGTGWPCALPGGTWSRPRLITTGARCQLLQLRRQRRGRGGRVVGRGGSAPCAPRASPPTARWSGPSRLAGRGRLYPNDVEVAPDGSAAIVYLRDNDQTGGTVGLAQRSASGGWVKRPLGRRHAAQLAFDGASRPFLAWRDADGSLRVGIGPAFEPLAAHDAEATPPWTRWRSVPAATSRCCGRPGRQLPGAPVPPRPRPSALGVSIARPGAPFAPETILGPTDATPRTVALAADGSGAVGLVRRTRASCSANWPRTARGYRPSISRRRCTATCSSPPRPAAPSLRRGTSSRPTAAEKCSSSPACSCARLRVLVAITVMHETLGRLVARVRGRCRTGSARSRDSRVDRRCSR